MAVLNDYLYSVTHPLLPSASATKLIPSLNGRVDWTVNHHDATYHVDFSDGGLNAYGVSPFDLDIRRIVVEFDVPFGVAIPGIPDSPFANATASNDYFQKIFGHGMPQWMTFAMADGTFRYWFARGVSREYTPDTTTPTWAKYRLQFVADEANLTSQTEVGGPNHWDDPNLSWDEAGILWDTATNTWTMTTAAPTVHSGGTYFQQRTLNALGSAATRDMQVIITNNDTHDAIGPFIVYNSGVFYGSTANVMFMSMGIFVPMGHLLPGGQLIFDIANTDVRINGFLGYPFFYKGSYQDEWFRLEPNSQILTFSVPDSNPGTMNLTLSVLYVPKYA